MKILVADDDEVVRTFVQRVAEHAGHEVSLAENGQQALEIAQQLDPDVLITDWRMPELDGYGLVQALRGLPRHSRLPVICLTSVSDRDDVIRMIESGISDYVLKPVRPGDLANRIQNVTRREQFWKAERLVEAPTAGSAAR